MGLTFSLISPDISLGCLCPVCFRNQWMAIDPLKVLLAAQFLTEFGLVFRVIKWQCLLGCWSYRPQGSLIFSLVGVLLEGLESCVLFLDPAILTQLQRICYPQESFLPCAKCILLNLFFSAKTWPWFCIDRLFACPVDLAHWMRNHQMYGSNHFCLFTLRTTSCY